MTSQLFIRSLFLVLLLSGCSRQWQEKPNIILVVIDDLGYADLGFLPHAASDVSTPNIDRLASTSVFFSRAYATSPICSPSRAGLITGKYQQRWGNYWYGEGGLPESEKKLPQLLSEQGYYTAKIGKTHMNGGPVEHPLDHGYQYFMGFMDHTWDYLRLSEKDEKAYGLKNAKRAHIGALIKNRDKVSFEQDYTTDIFSRETVRVIEDQDQPFFIHLSYNAVHHPIYVGHPAYLEKYGLQQFPFWDPARETYGQWHKKWGHLGEVDSDGRKRYLLQLNVLDDGIGKIWQTLERSGKSENTVIVLVSDNGGTINTYANNQPLSGYKYMFGEGGIRVPMMWYVPSIKMGRQENKQLVSAMDIMPTLLELAGAEVPPDLDGKSLLKILEEQKVPAQTVHDRLFWSDGRDQWVAMDRKWKLAHNIGWTHLNYKTEQGRQLRADPYEYGGGIQLYDLEKDEAEKTNLAARHPEIVTALTDSYWRWRNSMSDPKTGKGELKPLTGGYPRQNTLPEGIVNTYSNSSPINHYAACAFDGDPATSWQSKKGNDAAILPYFIVTALDQKRLIRGLRLFPKKGKRTSAIKNYSCYTSENGTDWQLITQGSFENDTFQKRVTFPEKVETAFLKFQMDALYEGPEATALSELEWLVE
ncbi:sulfatase-like hydrolase/transferase [Fulvivirga sp. M361]|uniref:sulfatase-like hydrolase/transferase n=1 Tax=Fulvivirga sp. M361 TaxID=2594266 RepID=UPI00117A884C|nr:sulfatase-like hydrolase/transferase [Fulvivirga sp. M361]TRX59159.1 sulfatase-like hydrolase/transferase [Fulvivirga sp. M361]